MINKLFLKLLFITSVLLISGCDIFQNYEDCGWLRIEDGNIDQFYQVGNNGERINIVSIGDALYGDNLIRCNWIHLYKDDNELKKYLQNYRQHRLCQWPLHPKLRKKRALGLF